MKNLGNFINTTELKPLSEGRRPKQIDIDKIDGKDAEKNGTDGKIGYNEPVDNSAMKVDIPKDQLDTNKKRLLMKFKAEDDFFIVGKAGWGKTSIIKDFAKRFGYEVITQYLDKCEAIDLGGIPVPGKDEKGHPTQIILPPPFAKPLSENPDQKFLLFFDEMNQAQPDVMNALMPIVLEHEIAGRKYGPTDKNGKVIESNFFVGAAGNFEDENDAVNELSGPLKSRFKPIIVWKTHDEESWKNAFQYLHKEWDAKISKTLVDKFEQAAMLFDNPREVELKLFERYIYRMIQRDDNFDVDEWYDHLLRVIDKDESELRRTDVKTMQELAEACFRAVKNKGKDAEETTGRRKRGSKDVNMIDNGLKNLIKTAMSDGYIPQDEDKDGNAVKDKNDPKYDHTTKYGISRENIFVVGEMDDSEINAEQMERLVNKFEADGVKFKYETNADFEKDGLADPLK